MTRHGERPAGWRWVTLGEVCRQEVETRNPTNAPDEEFDYIEISGIDRETKRIAATKRLLGADAPSRARRVVRTDDVLVATTRPNLNGVARVPARLDGQICTTGFCVLRATQALDPAYLFAWVQHPLFVQRLSTGTDGVLYPAVRDGDVLSQLIPLPPRAEQARIAAKLDEALGAVQAARAAVAEQMEAADVLRAGWQRAVWEQVEAESAAAAALGVVLRRRNAMVHPHDEPTGEAWFVGLEHIEPDTGRRLGAEAVKLEELTGRKPVFRRGDIVYGYLRPYLNKVWVAEFDGLCSVDQYVYQVADSRVDAEYVAAFMRSPLYLERAPVDGSPGQLPRIRLHEIAAVRLPMPTNGEASRWRARLAAGEQALSAARAALARQAEALDALPGAVLRQAFCGEL